MSEGNTSTTSSSIYYNNGRPFSTIDVNHEEYGGAYHCSTNFELGFDFNI
jgi:hypothetical protein